MMPNAYPNGALPQFVLHYLNTNKWNVLIAFASRFSFVSATHVLFITMPVVAHDVRALQILRGRTTMVSTRCRVAAGTNHTQQHWVTAGGRSRALIVLLAYEDQQDEQKTSGTLVADEH